MKKNLKGNKCMTSIDIEKIKGLIKKHTPEYLTLGGIIGMVNCVIIPKRRSNNWLKMHGYPMRRKKRRRKRS